MKTDIVTVQSSKIDKSGIFAARDFKIGEIVLHWDTSNTLTKEEYDKSTSDEKKYISFLDDKYVVMKSPEKYMNHSCNPNTRADNFCDIAIKDIELGEEITSDYNDDTAEFEIKCNCGAQNCKGIIKN